MGSGKPMAQLRLNLSRNFTAMLVKTARLKRVHTPLSQHTQINKTEELQETNIEKSDYSLMLVPLSKQC